MDRGIKMRKKVIIRFIVVIVCISFLTACSETKGKVAEGVLPSRIENILDKDIVSEGSEGIEKTEYDAAAFNRRMFYGTWNLQEAEGPDVTIEVPAPVGSGETDLSVKAFPECMIFYDAIRGPERKIKRIPFDEYSYLQAEYDIDSTDTKATESEDNNAEESLPGVEEKIEFRMLYDIVDKTLAAGFTGEVTDDRFYNEDVDQVDIREVDYGFSWSGYELTITYAGASATYVPSTFKGDMTEAVKGFSAGCGMDKLPDWHFSPLSMNGDGSGTISTLYDMKIPMKYSFGDDGDFSVVTDEGEEFVYDSYWYSDSCLTLPSGDEKMMYQQDVVVYYSGNEYLSKSVTSYALGNEFIVTGREKGSPLQQSVDQLIKNGYRTNVDTEMSRIPSGGVSPVFKLIFRTAHFDVRVFNPTNTTLPLSACIVCWYHCDDSSGGISKKLNFLIGDDTATCGVTTKEELQEFLNLHPVNDTTMMIQLEGRNYPSDYEFKDYGAKVLEGFADSYPTEVLVMETDGEILRDLTGYISDYCTGNAEYNVKDDRLPDFSKVDCDVTISNREDIAGSIIEEFSADSDISYDNYGTLYLRWPDVFSYGKAELSDDGKKLIEDIFSRYAGALKKYDDIEEIEIGTYARIEHIENNQSFTVSRAKAVCDYLNSTESLSGGDGLKPVITSTGYGESKYRIEGDMLHANENLVSIRFFMKPVKKSDIKEEKIDLVYYDDEENDNKNYLDVDEQAVGRRRAEFAEKYIGSYSADRYTNEAIGMEWILPEGWHFCRDEELISYNGGSAEEILLQDTPIYIFAAINNNYDTMIDIRLYPCNTGAYEEAGKEYTENLYNTYESVCRTLYSNVETESEDVKFGGRSVKKGTFRFIANDQNFTRKQYYLPLEDCVAVITASGAVDSAVLDDPGLKQ